MAHLSIENINLSAVTATVPKQVVSNADLRFEGVNNELLVKTLGIEHRRVAPPGLTAADLCFDAAERLIHLQQLHKEEINILIFVTQTPDHTIPGTSMHLQHRLGLSTACLCLDINQGCAGYVYGLSVISSLMESGRFKKGLLLVGDTITNTIAKDDASLIPLFSDAGSATLLEYKQGSPSSIFNLQTDGAGYEKIIVKGSGSRNTETQASCHLSMNGQDIFNFGLKEVAPNILSLLDHNDKTVADVDFFIMHQANLLLNETIRKKAGIENSKSLYSLRNFGNTSCASIPVTLAANAENFNSFEGNLLMAGFGVGLSWGSCLISVKDFICIPVAQI